MAPSENTTTSIRAARVLEEHAEEILADYTRRLREQGSLLLAGDQEGEAVREARHLLGRAVRALRGEESWALQIEEEIQENLEAARFPLVQHPDESFRAGVALCRAALEMLGKRLDLSGASPQEIFEISLALQESVMDRVARVAMVAYVDYLLTKIGEVQGEERQRFSRELHDRIAHTMALVNQDLELYQVLRGRSPELAEEKLARARENTRRAIEVARDLAIELRQTEAGESLKAGLGNLMRASIPPGVDYEVSFEGDEDLLPPHVRDQLYMILREGVRNAVAHSGSNRVTIEVGITPGEAWAAVSDRGAGFDTAEVRQGVGLCSMSERAALLGGSFDLDSSPEKGTRAEVRIPLRGRRKR